VVALAAVVASNFFWVPAEADLADKSKSAIDNLSKALGLEGSDAPGWEALGAYAAEPSTMPDPQRTGVVCAPAEPTFDDKAADELAKRGLVTPSQRFDEAHVLARQQLLHAPTVTRMASAR